MRERVSAEAVEERLEINIELASPDDFIPALPGWEERSTFITRGLIEPRRLLELFSRIEDELYKYPAIDGKSFRQAVEEFVEQDFRIEQDYHDKS